MAAATKTVGSAPRERESGSFVATTAAEAELQTAMKTATTSALDPIRDGKPLTVGTPCAA